VSELTRKIRLFDAYPHQKHILTWEPTRFEVVMCPARAGKGVLGACKTALKIIEMYPIWSIRDPKTFQQPYVVWCVAPTYLLAEQQWLDMQAYLPKRLWDGPAVKSPIMSIPLIHNGVIEFKSADRPAGLVSKPVDYAWLTEGREIDSMTWSFVRQRLMSPERLKYSGALIEGTAGRIVDPKDPQKLHWFWAMVLSGRGQHRNPDYRSFYWFEDKKDFGNLDHPILSRTPEGRAEIESMRNDPNMSEEEFRMGVLGECLSGRTGKPTIKGFQPPVHIAETQYNPRHILYRSWDFGRQYPACTFHQLTSDGVWEVLAEHCPILQDVLDIEFGWQVQELTKKLFGNIDPGKIYDYGDFESTHKEDSRRETTQQAFKKELGIDLIVEPTGHGDEAMAIETMNARMRIFNSGPIFRINPRCEYSIKGFSGNWIFETGKSGDIEWIKDSVAEIHPFIDVFDTFKYFVRHVLKPLKSRQYREDDRKKRPMRRMITDEYGAPTGQYEETYAGR
jgi:hypothetical protein